jgi:hypothetical protein
MIAAHVAGVPVEELIPAAAGAGSALLLARAWLWVWLRRDPRDARDQRDPRAQGDRSPAA